MKVLHDDAVYVTEELTVDAPDKGIHVTADGLRREVKAGRLKCYRRVGRNYYLGKDLKEWLKGGERFTQQSDDEYEPEIADPRELSTR